MNKDIKEIKDTYNKFEKDVFVQQCNKIVKFNLEEHQKQERKAQSTQSHPFNWLRTFCMSAKNFSTSNRLTHPSGQYMP